MSRSSHPGGNRSVSATLTLVRTLAAALAVMVVTTYGARVGVASPLSEADPKGVSQPGAAPPERRLPNVLLISLDTLRADFVREAPFLSQLAQHGRAFSKVYSSSNWTLPSHVSLLSSLPYFEHNVPQPGASRPYLDSHLAADQPTLASVLQASGYATAASTEGGWVTPHYGMLKGFESFETTPSPARGISDSPTEHLKFARSFVRRSEGRPFFLFVHTYLVYDYFVNTKPYHELLAPEDARYVAYGNLIERKKANLPLPPQAFIKRLYTAGVHAADKFVEQLVAAVREESGDAPLLVVVTSDHGESLGEQDGQFGHGSLLNDFQTRIPLVVWTNAAPPVHGDVDSLVSTIDIAPSVVRRLGLAVPERFRGRDDLFQPSVGDRSSPVLIQQYGEKEQPTVGRIRNALIWNDSKYLRSDRFDGTSVSETCYAVPQVPEAEPTWGAAMKGECMPFRDQFVHAFDAPPQVSFRLEGNRPVEMRQGGPALAAVFSAYPSTAPILSPSDGVLSWKPPNSGGWLVGYPSDAESSISSIAVGGRRRKFKDVRLVDLAAVAQLAALETLSASLEAGGSFSVRTRGLEQLKRVPPTPDKVVLERLRALGYDEQK